MFVANENNAVAPTNPADVAGDIFNTESKRTYTEYRVQKSLTGLDCECRHRTNTTESGSPLQF